MQCDFFEVLLWSLISLLVLFFMSKLMGTKQISQLNAFDYIVGISIGSIAAELAGLQGVDRPLNSILAIVIYGTVAYLISMLTTKNISLRKIITGRPITIMEDGKIYKQNLAKARLDISDFLTLCREQGYFDIGEIKSAIIEHDGKLSILPMAQHRPVTPADMQLQVEPDELLTVVVMDGHILSNNLRLTGHDVEWLEAMLKKQKLNFENVFLAFCDENDNVTAYKMYDNKVEVDRFE